MNKKDLDKKIIDLENTYNVALKKLLIKVDDVTDLFYRLNILQSIKYKIDFLKELENEEINSETKD